MEGMTFMNISRILRIATFYLEFSSAQKKVSQKSMNLFEMMNIWYSFPPDSDIDIADPFSKKNRVRNFK